MRKVISLSGLLAGLIAAPGFAAPAAVRAPEEVAGQVGMSSAEILPARKLTEEEIGRLQGALVDMAEKGPLDVGGMIAMQRRLAAEIQWHLAGAMLADAGPADRPGAAIAADDPAPAGGRRMEKAAFLGVTASRVDSDLRAQLRLEKGMGLVVDFVAPNSPAQAAGILPHDVLVKFEDQKLIDLEQLAVLVRSKKAGDEVKLSIIRGGKPATVSATLQEREVPVLNAPVEEGESGVMQLQGPLVLQFGGQGAWRVGWRIKIVNGADGSAVRTMTDDKNTIELTRDSHGAHTLVVTDKAGAEVFRGGWDTAAEKKRVPAAFEGKAENLAAATANSGVAAPPGALPGDTGEGTLQMAVIRFERADAQDDIVLTLTKAGRSVVVKDAKTGKVIYEGPADTEKDLQKMPPRIAEKIRAMEAPPK